MFLHPTILFDKSVVIGLSYKDFENISYHFSPFITPPLINELIGELGKSGELTNFKNKLQLLSKKCSTISAKTVSAYNNFLLADLMGEAIPLDGRIPESRGTMVRHKDGTTGYIIDEPEENKALKRWAKGQFTDLDFKTGCQAKKMKEVCKNIPHYIKESDKDFRCSFDADFKHFSIKILY